MDVGTTLQASLKRYARHLWDGEDTTRTASGHDRSLVAVDEIALQIPAPGGNGQWSSISATQLLVPLSNDDVTLATWTCAASTARALLLHDTGGGTLATHGLLAAVLRDWCEGVVVFKHLSNYQVVLAVSGRQLVNHGLWSTLHQLAPDEVSSLGDEKVEDYVTGASALVLVHDWPAPEVYLDVDDIQDGAVRVDNPTESKSQLEKETLEYYVNDLPNAKFIFLTSEFKIPSLLRVFTEELNCFALPVKVCCADVNQALPTLSASNSFGRIVQWAEDSPWRTRLLLSPGSKRYISNLLLNHASLKECSSICELLWSIVQIKITTFEKMYKVTSNASSELLLSLGSLAYEVECNGSVNAINTTHEYWERFLYAMLIPTKEIGYGGEKFNFNFIHSYHRHVLAGWYVFHQQKPLLPALKWTMSGDSVGAMVAGHLLRTIITNPGNLENHNTKSLLKNLFLRSEHCDDPMTYLLNVLSEFRCNDQLVTMLFRDAVFQRQLELFDSAFLLEPLKCYLRWAEPSRILLIVRPGEKSYQIQSIIKHVSDISVRFGLGLMHHLDWRNESDSDDILATALAASQARLHDFLGCLTISGVRLLSPASSPHLTCLRVRVNNEETLVELFKVQSTLPQLMWFEVDFDLPLTSIFMADLPAITTPLCDVSFRNMADSGIIPFLDFISKIRKSYFSGLHLHESSLSVSAVVHLLKELQLRGIKLSTPAEEVTRYRIWRFPELAVLTKAELWEEDKVRHLLGYDDRRQYSDNEVRSQHWANARELSSLEATLDAIDNIVFFEYGCKNVLMTKNTNGSVSKRALILEYNPDKGNN